MEVKTYASFLIRRWCDPHSQNEIGDWHAEVECIQTGMRWGFSAPADLFAFLERAIAAPQTLAQAAPDETQ